MILKFDLWLSGAVFWIWFGLCANIINIFIGAAPFWYDWARFGDLSGAPPITYLPSLVVATYVLYWAILWLGLSQIARNWINIRNIFTYAHHVTKTHLAWCCLLCDLPKFGLYKSDRENSLGVWEGERNLAIKCTLGLIISNEYFTSLSMWLCGTCLTLFIQNIFMCHALAHILGRGNWLTLILPSLLLHGNQYFFVFLKFPHL